MTLVRDLSHSVLYMLDLLNIKIVDVNQCIADRILKYEGLHSDTAVAFYHNKIRLDVFTVTLTNIEKLRSNVISFYPIFSPDGIY